MKTKKEQEDKAIDWVHNYGDFMLKQGVKEGKAQALADVMKIIDEWGKRKGYACDFVDIEELKAELKTSQETTE